jgi:hypothetical protein
LFQVQTFGGTYSDESVMFGTHVFGANVN